MLTFRYIHGHDPQTDKQKESNIVKKIRKKLKKNLSFQIKEIEAEENIEIRSIEQIMIG